MKKILLAGALAATTMLGASTVSAGTIQLGFILDRSGSIGGSNWNLIVDGLASAVSGIPLPGDDTYKVSVVSFAETASIDIANFEVNSVATRDALSTAIFNLGDGRSNDVYIGGVTNYEDAFNKMTTALGDMTGVDFSYVNFATDGAPNTVGSGDSTSNPGTLASNNAGIAARDLMIAAGVDNISIEGIGSVSATNLQSNYCYPQPCDIDGDPSDTFDSQGFYLSVATPADYAAAIDYKIRVVTDQLVPAPAPIALLGFGLIGGLLLRRKRTAA